jgi:hypothetical protein
MDSNKLETRINLDAPAYADELSQNEFREAVRSIARNLRWNRRPPLPSIGEVLRARETARQGGK